MASIKEKVISFLRSTEKYTKTDMVYFTKNNFWLNLNRVSGIANGLILSVAFAHLLTKEAYGTYSFVLAALGIFSMAQTTGLGSGIIKGVARKENHVVMQGLRKVLPWSLVGATGLLGLSIYYFAKGNIELFIPFLLGAIVLPISVSNGIAKSFLSNRGDFGWLARFNLIRTPIVTIIIVLVGWHTRSALFILVANILTNTILGSILYTKIRKLHDFSTPAEPKEHFDSRFAFHSGLLSIFGYLSEKIDSILLWKFLGAAPVAVFTYATTPVRELRSLIENQSLLALPKFAQKSFSEVQSNLFFRIKQLYVLAIPLALGYVLFAPLIFKFLFPQYIEAVGLSQLAAISLLSSPRKMLGVAISAQHLVKESYIMTLLPNLIRIVAAFSLIPPFGIKGAVWALIITEIVDYAILGILMRKMKTEHTII